MDSLVDLGQLQLRLLDAWAEMCQAWAPLLERAQSDAQPEWLSAACGEQLVHGALSLLRILDVLPHSQPAAGACQQRQRVLMMGSVDLRNMAKDQSPIPADAAAQKVPFPWGPWLGSMAHLAQLLRGQPWAAAAAGGAAAGEGQAVLESSSWVERCQLVDALAELVRWEQELPFQFAGRTVAVLLDQGIVLVSERCVCGGGNGVGVAGGACL